MSGLDYLVDGARIVTIGDSNTAALGDPAGGWRAQLRTRLNAHPWTHRFWGRSIWGSFDNPQHEGYPGFTIDELQDLLSDMTAALPIPTLCLVFSGTVTVRNGGDVSPLEDQRAFLQELTLRWPAATVVAGTLPPRTDSASFAYPDGINVYNAGLYGLTADLRRQGRDVRYADVASAVTVFDLADEVHLTAAGYAKIGDRWYEKLVALGIVS